MSNYGYDAVAALISDIPRNAYAVMGYVTGGPGIVWNQSNFNSFTAVRKGYIDQGHGTPWRRPNIIDVESGDYTPAQIPARSAALARIYGADAYADDPLTVYCMISNLPTVASVWKGQVWLAAPSYPTDAQAEALRAQYPHINIVGIQNYWVTNRYDRTLMFSDTWLNPNKSTPAGPKPPATPHLKVGGWNLPKAPQNGKVPAVLSWYGDNGLVTRQANIPEKLWNQIEWTPEAK